MVQPAHLNYSKLSTENLIMVSSIRPQYQKNKIHTKPKHVLFSKLKYIFFNVKVNKHDKRRPQIVSITKKAWEVNVRVQKDKLKKETDWRFA